MTHLIKLRSLPTMGSAISCRNGLTYRNSPPSNHIPRQLGGYTFKPQYVDAVESLRHLYPYGPNNYWNKMPHAISVNKTLQKYWQKPAMQIKKISLLEKCKTLLEKGLINERKQLLNLKILSRIMLRLALTRAKAYLVGSIPTIKQREFVRVKYLEKAHNSLPSTKRQCWKIIYHQSSKDGKCNSNAMKETLPSFTKG